MGYGESAKYRVGVLFSKREILTGVVDNRHRIVSRAGLALNAVCDYRETAAHVAECVRAATAPLDLSPEDCAAVGVGCPGITNCKTGEVIYSGSMAWNHVPLGKELQKHFTIPVAVAESGGCMALGEILAGAAMRCTHVVLFQFENGISSGVVTDGKLFTGKYCAGARLEHCTIVSGGKDCSCGRKGCFEAYASFQALGEQARRIAARYKNTLLGQHDLQMITPMEILECVKKGDRAARQVMNQYMDYVCDGIVSAVNIFRPEIVVLDGEEGRFWKELLDEINLRCCARYYGGAVLPIPKVAVGIGRDAGIIGAGEIKGCC